MVGFAEGYKFFVDNSSAIIGAEVSDSYIGAVNEEIDKLVRNLNIFEGFKTSSKMLKGDIAEFWHSGTFNIKAAVEGSEHRTFVDRSHDFASADISSNFGDRYGLKFYGDGQASAKAQSISIFQRFKEYQGSGGKDDLNKFLTDRGFDDADTILSDPIYSGQIRIIPRDQLEEANKWLNRMIQTESARRSEQVHRYQETLDLLSDRLSDNKGVESIPLSKKEAEDFATLAKQGNINADDLGITADDIIKFDNIMQRAFKAGITAATISVMLKIVPEIYKAISYLIKSGEIDDERFKKKGFDAISGGAEGFIRGTISSALTTCFRAGVLGIAIESNEAAVIGAVTALTMNVLKNAYAVAIGKKTRQQLTGELVRDMYLTACSLVGGGITQAFIEVPILGYLIGSFIGSIVGSFTYNVGQKAIVAFCVDSGFTMFGLVEQDYKLPKDVIDEIGIETFDYETIEIDSFKPETFAIETFNVDTFEPDTLDITFLRRGVIGVSRVGYIN